MILQPVTDIAEICARHELKNVVLSPGSRCAPLTIAFARHSEMQVRTVSDERAAAFIGLGMAQISGKASVLVCTSGTAAYNYAPAVAEAFYQQIPANSFYRRPAPANGSTSSTGKRSGKPIFTGSTSNKASTSRRICSTRTPSGMPTAWFRKPSI